mgnify:FL=1
MAGRRRVREHRGFPTTIKPGATARGCYTSASTWQAGLNFADDCQPADIKARGLGPELFELLDDHAFHLEQYHWFVAKWKIYTDQSDHFAIRTLCVSNRKTDTRVEWRQSSPSSRRRRRN